MLRETPRAFRLRGLLWLLAATGVLACSDAAPGGDARSAQVASQPGSSGGPKPGGAASASASALAASSAAATASAAIDAGSPAWTVPRTPSDLPTEADWDGGKTDVETSKESPSTMCSLRLVREWAAIRCKDSVALVTEQLDLGKVGTDYVVGTASGGTTFIRLRPGIAGYAKLASESDVAAHFSYSWAESAPAPTYLILSEKNRHHQVVTRADQKPVDAPPAVSEPLSSRPKPGDWSIATRLTGGPKAPGDCAVLALQDWLRIHCKRPLSNTELEQYSFLPGDGVGTKGQDHFAEMRGLVGTEIVVDLRMQKGKQTGKIRVNPVTGTRHALTVEWPEGEKGPTRVALEGKR